MAEANGRRRGKDAEHAQHVDDADDAERSLGAAVALGLPALVVAIAAVVGVVSGIGPALLILGGGALLGAIALLWASVRTLSGDAPLPVDLEALAARGRAVDGLADRKRRVLGALKDLESEHALGKIDDEDYDTFVARYRNDAKEIMREMDTRVAPMREQAERLAREHLERQGVLGQSIVKPIPAAAAEHVARIPCKGCGTSNEADATFCKSCGMAVHAMARG
jgi:hypothetical protein